MLVGSEQIAVSQVAMDLGVLLDRYLNMEAHVRYICRSAYMLGLLALRASAAPCPRLLKYLCML